MIIWLLVQFLPFQIGVELSHYNQDSQVVSALSTFGTTISGLDRAITGGKLPVHKRLFTISSLFPTFAQEAKQATHIPEEYQYGFNGKDYLYWSDGTSFCLYGMRTSLFNHPSTVSSLCNPASEIGIDTSDSNYFYNDPSVLGDYTLVVGGTILTPGKIPSIPATITPSYSAESTPTGTY